jgi:hypothetical protein
VVSLARKRLGDHENARAADAPQAEVVRVLAVVDQLDPHALVRDADAGERERELVGHGLQPGRVPGRRPAGNQEGKRDGGEGETAPHRKSAARAKLPALGMIAAASAANHCSRMEQ